MSDFSTIEKEPEAEDKKPRKPRVAYLNTEWVTDAELIKRSGVPEPTMRRLLRMWDAQPRFGFPPKVELYGNRRYWPHVQAYFARASQDKIPVFAGRNRNGR
jgi:hypothetical protein